MATVSLNVATIRILLVRKSEPTTRALTTVLVKGICTDTVNRNVATRGKFDTISVWLGGTGTNKDK
jgi:hypothetical protein